MTNFEKIIIFLVGLLIIAVLFVGAIVFRQQKDITTLKTGAASANPSQSNLQSFTKKNSPPLTEIIKQFGGTIESISGNQLTVAAKLFDLSKSQNTSGSVGEGNKVIEKKILVSTNGKTVLEWDDSMIINKKMTVNINEKTVFEKKPLAELKVGDDISISSDKSPYLTDTVTAEKVTFFEAPK